MKYRVQIMPDGCVRGHHVQAFTMSVSTRPDVGHILEATGGLSKGIGMVLWKIMSREWVVSLLPKGGVGLEIGVDWGDGLRCWLQSEPAKVYAVDPYLSQDFDDWFDQEQGEMDARYEAVVESFHGEPVSFQRMTSDEFFSGTNESFRWKFDWVHIDGDHRQEAVERDLENAIIHTKPGGLIIIDDWSCARWRDDIRGAAEKVLAKNGGDVEVLTSGHDPCVWRKR